MTQILKNAGGGGTNCQVSRFAQNFGRGLKGNSSNQKQGFTLAEVLITLAIIGVIAALTVPTLISNYQKKQYVTQLKKSYSTLQNGFKSYMASNGVTKLSDTPLILSIEGDNTRDGSQIEFRKEMAKIFPVIQSHSTNEPMSSCPIVSYGVLNTPNKRVNNDCNFSVVFVMNDGTIFAFLISNEAQCGKKCKDNNLSGELGSITVDVNGKKGPNIYGRDIFGLVLYDNGNIYGAESKYYALHYCKYVNDSCSDYWRYDDNSECSVSQYSDGCAARIMEEGWEMKY